MISFLLLRGFIKKEFMQALRDPRMRILLFIAPVIQLTLFGIALSNDVKNIRLWAKTTPKDFILQHIYDRSIESKWFLPTKTNPNQDPFLLLEAGEIDAALIPPPGGLTRAIQRDEGNLQLLVNATNVIQAQSVELYIKNIIDKVISEDLKPILVKPLINFSVRVLYNPTLETSYFMVPGVMCILICMITIVLTSASITREKELGTFEMLISAPVSASEVLLGKTIPYVVLGMCNAPLVLAVAILGFNVPMRGPLLSFLLVTFIFVCTTVAIGTLISSFAKNQQQSILGGFLFLFPAIMLSGLLFPLENMPNFIKWISFLDPLSYYLSLLRNILLKGGEWDFIVKNSIILFIMAVIFIYISYKRFHTTLE